MSANNDHFLELIAQCKQWCLKQMKDRLNAMERTYDTCNRTQCATKLDEPQ